MGSDIHSAQLVTTTLLNLAVAVLAGSAMSSLWLGEHSSAWSAARQRSVAWLARSAALLAVVSTASALWLEAAVMAELPPADAWPAVQTMLESTHYGLAWTVGTSALAVTALAWFLPGIGLRALAAAALFALAVFWYTRSMVSHAASEGDFSVPLLVDWVHLGLISVWVGEVVVGALATMARHTPMQAADRKARAAYVAALSSSATVALAGIFVTGAYGAWRNAGGVAAMIGSSYGKLLLIKLLLVGLAALLGGFNRFVVMPGWLAAERAGKAAGEYPRKRFRLTLLTEAFVLLAALYFAAMLASTAQPGMPT